MTGQNPFQMFNPGVFSSPFQAYFSNLDSMAQSMGPMKGVARLQLEVMGYMSRRAQAYMEIPTRLSRCRTPQDLMSEQSRFWHTAFQQYAESNKRIMDAWTQVMPNPFAATAASKPAERDYISFGDPKEANGRARTAEDRHAA